jgi:hypothetical protein
MTKKTKIIERVVAVIVAVILLQTLPFKFTGAADTVSLFTQLGVEPWGRYLTAILELFAGISLLVPKCAKKGAVVAMVVMAGALLTHIFVIGVFGEALPLTLMALTAFLGAAFVYKVRK